MLLLKSWTKMAINTVMSVFLQFMGGICSACSSFCLNNQVIYIYIYIFFPNIRLFHGFPMSVLDAGGV